jgi:hypothetical protein
MHLGIYLVHLYFVHFTILRQGFWFMSEHNLPSVTWFLHVNQILVITKFFLGNNNTKCKLLVPFNFFHASFHLRKSLSLRNIWSLCSSHLCDVILCSLVGSTNISEELALTTALQQGYTSFPKVQEALESFYTKFRCLGDLAAGLCAPLICNVPCICNVLCICNQVSMGQTSC